MTLHTHRFITVLLLLYIAPALAQTSSLHPVKDTPAAAAFTLTDMDGKQHSLSDYRGKVVIVNFWATWCPPCRYELPSMEKAWQKLKPKGVIMLGINVGEDADTIFPFTADYPVSFPLLLDRDSAVTKKYPVIGLPTTYVINSAGKIIYRAIGTREWDDDALIDAILRVR